MELTSNRDKRIDTYIENAASFSQPILKHLRNVIHKTSHQIIENIKWGMPCFEFHGILCNMASFKNHCTFGFWKASLMKDKILIKNAQAETAMGHLGKLTSLKDLPADKKIMDWIKEAMALNEKGIKVEKKKPAQAKLLKAPNYFINELKKNKIAFRIFEKFSQSHKNEYLEWIIEAKTEPTRIKRMQQAIEMMTEGKPRKWKYMKEYANK